MKVIKSIISGIFVSYILSIILILIFSMLLVNTNIKEQYISTVIIVISGISILVGTTLSTRKMDKNGILNGTVISFSYVLFLYIISSLVTANFSITGNLVLFTFFALLLGVFGGVLGVNIKS